jgi:hypothetical protein
MESLGIYSSNHSVLAMDARATLRVNQYSFQIPNHDCFKHASSQIKAEQTNGCLSAWTNYAQMIM